MTEKVCKTCKFSDLSYMQSPCDVCLARDNFPEWWPKEPEKLVVYELRPCPHCGSKAKFSDVEGWRRIICTNDECACQTTGWWNDASAAAAWNKRVRVVERTFEDMQKSLFQNTPHTWNKRAETSRYVLEQAIGALRSENERKDEEIKRLRDNLIQCRGENAELYDYAADLRIAIRKARKVLKELSDYIAPDGTMYAEVIEARQILKDALKEGK